MHAAAATQQRWQQQQLKQERGWSITRMQQ
jgi:hypothetical protein